LKSLADVARTGARFVNRPLGSGTRVLVDELLALDGVAPAAIAGYAHSEASHTAVAEAVAAGAADAGIGIEMVARARGLAFIPLAHERYHLACLKSSLDQPATKALRTLLQTADWLDQMAALPGYTPLRCGEVLSMSSVLAWWQFARKKPPSRT
jgi:putative molybdopterin biosynthesis protein